MQFSARLAAIRSTPSRKDDVDTVSRILFEAHDLEGIAWLTANLGHDITIDIAADPLPRLPLDAALEASTNGRVEPEDQPVEVSAGRRRRGTKATPTEDV